MLGASFPLFASWLCSFLAVSSCWNFYISVHKCHHLKTGDKSQLPKEIFLVSACGPPQRHVLTLLSSVGCPCNSLSSFPGHGPRLLSLLETRSLQSGCPGLIVDGMDFSETQLLVLFFFFCLSKSFLISYEHPACHKSYGQVYIPVPNICSTFPCFIALFLPSWIPRTGLAYMLWGKALFFRGLGLRHHFIVRIKWKVFREYLT